eukprot:scaffold4349_cov258-Pinguiococcus_pyrenoidosus.AAC.9
MERPRQRQLRNDHDSLHTSICVVRRTIGGRKKPQATAQPPLLILLRLRLSSYSTQPKQRFVWMPKENKVHTTPVLPCRLLLALLLLWINLSSSDAALLSEVGTWGLCVAISDPMCSSALMEATNWLMRFKRLSACDSGKEE